MIKEELYIKAVMKWGTDSQTALMVEECAELIQAIQKYYYRGGCVADVVEELADVEIMCEQMRIVFDPEAIDLIKKQKLARLERMLCQ